MKKALFIFGAIAALFSLLPLAYYLVIVYPPVSDDRIVFVSRFIHAELGDPDAQYHLGNAYYDGKGVTMDRVESGEMVS